MMKASRHMLEVLPITLPFQLSTLHGILCHLPDKALFKFQEAPFFAERCVTSRQADQDERGQHRQPHQASCTPSLLGHLHLPQVQPALQLFDGQLEVPLRRPLYT